MPKTHRSWEPAFRQQAVHLLLQSGRPLDTVAAELGVSANNMRTWRDRALRPAPLADPAAEILRLHRENEYRRGQDGVR